MSLKEQVHQTFEGTKHRVIQEVLEHGIPFQEHKMYHLRSAAEHLNKGSIIAPWCHLGSLDPFLIMKHLRINFGDEMKRFIVPGSMKFFDGRLGASATYMMEKVKDKYNVEVVPIIQHNDDTYSDEIKHELNTRSLDTMISALNEPGTVVSLAPEGTRSRWGGMNEAQSGITKLIRKAPESVVLPIGIAGSENIMDINFNYNPFGIASFTYGYPESTKSLIKSSKEQGVHIKDYVMLRIAEEIPVETHGYYGYARFPWYYNNLVTRNRFIPESREEIPEY